MNINPTYMNMFVYIRSNNDRSPDGQHMPASSRCLYLAKICTSSYLEHSISHCVVCRHVNYIITVVVLWLLSGWTCKVSPACSPWLLWLRLRAQLSMVTYTAADCVLYMYMYAGCIQQLWTPFITFFCSL